MLSKMELDDAHQPRLTGRPSQEAAAELGERLLSIAFECFIAKGFAATSIEAVATAASINKRTIYRRYEVKQNLFYAVIRWKFGQFTQRYEMGAQSGHELHFLRVLLRDLFDFTLEPSVLKLLKIIISESDRFPSIIEQVFHGRTTRLASILEDTLFVLADRDILRIADPVATRRQIMPDFMSDAWLKHMLGLNPLDTVEKRDRYFEQRWQAFLSQHSC